ncbi:phosphoglycerate mutase-like protein [Gloeophyllum trabeum ATCC 11539]|uniref:Phosphoglycerate mutase-like protein n=1 Tax=Gloeophyllum trabeum (strain ATCC 11539 / FP-39264 / Madison 617) TaxID=670483 RepID=S7S3Y7_GLOTA|nr:phosphoglycerate mutase-like protein [Gloeophyllum trabeum ATCC 11539]EPQ60549.1 phosphoglycerate mutase-like protein [Gloeophyllum trabeum ATCC 11539]
MLSGLLLLLLGVAPSVLTSAVPRAAHSASDWAGSTTSAVWPPPEATNTGLSSYFPDASQVGYPGPTPTGDEAEAIQTAPPSDMESIYPLTDPKASGSESSGFDVIRYWGNLSPWYSVPSSTHGLPDASPEDPDGCSINQVHLLHRHGARYPTSGAGPASFAAKLHNTSTTTGFSASGPLKFLNTWTYKLGAELLTPFGREELFDLGVGFRVKYGDLLKGFTELPVFRTTSEERMVESALNFAAGFFGVQTYQTDYHQLIIIEEDGYNNTLAPWNACPNNNAENIGYYGDSLQEQWIEQYLTPTLKRVAPLIQGFNLTITDLYHMQQACAYETVALGFSDFCSVFTQEEWEGFNYANDLSFWYSTGPGNPTSAAIGLGWVGEMMARLTQTPIDGPFAEVNTTLTNNVTFPLNQPIYVDATHDTIISAIVATMNFTSLAAGGPLPVDHIPANRSWITTQVSPFASNLVGQVLSCPASNVSTHIRWILNDAVMPLTGLKGCQEDPNGLCELSAFIAGMQERMAEIDYDFDCFANYTVPTPDTIIDGRYPPALRNGTA